MNKIYKNVSYDGGDIKFDSVKLMELLCDYMIKSNHNGKSALDKEQQPQIVKQKYELIPEEERVFIPEEHLQLF